MPDSVKFSGGVAQATDRQTGESEQAQFASFYDGSIQGLGIGPGVLLTSGDGTPPQSNTQVGYTDAFVDGSTSGDAALDTVANNAFEGSGETFDVSILECKVTVDQNLTQKGIQFDLVFGSDEFPEFSDSSFVEVAGVFVNGEHVGQFNQNNNQPLSIISENLDVGNFRATGSSVSDPGGPVPEGTPTTELPLEYDGVSSRVKVVAPLEVGENTIKIGVADTGDQRFDSGLFVSNLATTAPTGAAGFSRTSRERQAMTR